MATNAIADISVVAVTFLRVYIVTGFIVAIMLNVWIIRKLEKIEEIIFKNRSYYETHPMGGSRGNGDPHSEHADSQAPEGGQED